MRAVIIVSFNKRFFIGILREKLIVASSLHQFDFMSIAYPENRRQESLDGFLDKRSRVSVLFILGSLKKIKKST